MLTLSDGSTVEAERLLVATGRSPNVEELGLEKVGVTVGEQGIEIDERCRAAEDVWAIGDVTGVALFTHVGKYQARVAAADMVGPRREGGLPRDPGRRLHRPGGRDGRDDRRRLGALGAHVDPRLATYERPKRDGFVRLFADPEKRVLVGAVAVGPQAAEWLGQLTLAVRAETPIDVLLDTIQPYPTFSEAIFLALRELEGALAAAD